MKNYKVTYTHFVTDKGFVHLDFAEIPHTELGAKLARAGYFSEIVKAQSAAHAMGKVVRRLEAKLGVSSELFEVFQWGNPLPLRSLKME